METINHIWAQVIPHLFQSMIERGQQKESLTSEAPFSGEKKTKNVAIISLMCPPHSSFCICLFPDYLPFFFLLKSWTLNEGHDAVRCYLSTANEEELKPTEKVIKDKSKNQKTECVPWSNWKLRVSKTFATINFQSLVLFLPVL